MLRLDSPLGRLEVQGDGRAITALRFLTRIPSTELHPESTDAVLHRAAGQLEEYFAGRRKRFTVPLAPRGTAFQRAVWDALADIPWGGVTSYGELGLAVLGTAAGRAVGSAIRANRIPLLIPCHRVLDASGRITGYSQGDGTETKLWLLAHEGVLLGRQESA